MTGLPIRDAVVQAYRDSPLALEAGLSLEGDRVAQAKTDASGSCLVPLGRWDGQLRLQASADGHADAESHVPTGVHEAVLSLPEGMELGGVVTDPAGRPTPGLRVEARSVGASRAVLDSGAAGRPGRSFAVTDSDSAGRFQFRCLSAGLYELDATGDGWGAWHPRGHGERPPERFFRAGIVDARLTVQRIRALRMRLSDARTGQPISRDLAGRVTAEHLEGVYFVVEANSLSLSAGDHRLDGRQSRPGEGLYAGFVCLGESVDAADTATIRVRVPGYRRTVAQGIHLLVPSALSCEGIVDEIRLEPEPAMERTGVVILDCSRRADGYWRSPSRALWVASLSEAIEGRSLGGERWAFSGVPEGPHTVQVLDGLSTSEALVVDVRAGAETEASAKFPDPTGITIELQDAVGNRLFPATCPEWVAEEEANVPFPNWTSGDPLLAEALLDPATGRRLMFVESVRPGRYVVRVGAPGYEDASVTAEVRAGAVTRIVARLEERP